LRTTRFGNGAEKARKITETKPDAMAARKKTRKKTKPSTTSSRMRTFYPQELNATTLLTDSEGKPADGSACQRNPI
jgi:hypothetical protein